MVTYTVPGLKTDSAERVVKLLQDRLNSLNDLALTLKHVHWNVTGPNFIAVHTMLDPQVNAVRAMVDETAERIAALGASPVGTPGALVAQRDWDDYSIGRAGTLEHLGALDVVYAGIIEAHRRAIDSTEELNLVTQDMLIGQPASWKNSTGSSAPTWRHPTDRSPPGTPARRRQPPSAPRSVSPVPVLSAQPDGASRDA